MITVLAQSWADTAGPGIGIGAVLAGGGIFLYLSRKGMR